MAAAKKAKKKAAKKKTIKKSAARKKTAKEKIPPPFSINQLLTPSSNTKFKYLHLAWNNVPPLRGTGG